MPINDVNRTDSQDNAVVAIGESGSANIAGLTLKTNSKYGLEVIAEIVTLPTDVATVVHAAVKLLSGASASMNVNGSVTPVVFSQTVTAGQTWYMTEISVLLSATGTPDPGDFADLAALTNGLIIEYVSGVTYTICNLQNNSDVSLFYSESRLIPPIGSGFLNSSDLYVGTFRFDPPLKMPDGAVIRARVRDNITAVSFLNMNIKYWRGI